MIELELAILFLASLLFSLFYEINSDFVFAGILATGFWWIFSLVYFVADRSTYILSLLWSGLGFIYLLRWFSQLLYRQKLQRHGLGDEEL